MAGKQPLIKKTEAEDSEAWYVKAVKDTFEFYGQEIFRKRANEDITYQNLQEVVEAETDFIKKSHETRQVVARDRCLQGLEEFHGKRFSVAFSGGGIRAAAFQAGVLWRLAEEDKLKDVDYLTAVSGGSYITTAFATHCMNKELQPKRGDNIKDWYKMVVAKTMIRMQENCGNFVRDCVKEPGHGPKDLDYATFPRACDGVCLLGMIFYTISINPVVISLCIAIPIVNVTETFYGSALRASFCAPPDDWTAVFYKMAEIDKLLWIAGFMLIVTFVSMILLKVAKKPAPWTDRLKPPPPVPRGYKCFRSISFLGTRCTGICLAFLLYLFLIPWYERALYEKEPETKNALCCAYMADPAKHDDDSCDDRMSTWKEQSVTCDIIGQYVPQHKHVEPSGSAPDVSGYLRGLVSGHGGVWGPLFICILGLFAVFALLIPFLGAGVAMNVLFIAGPLCVFAALVLLATIPVYGPITQNAKGGTLSYDQFTSLSKTSILIAMILAPCYEGFRNLFHVYYRHTLVTNYFKNGEDAPLQDLGRNPKTGTIDAPFAPFIMFTGTCSDYQAAGDDDTIAEISFSPLHIGSEETQYVPTQHWVTLGTGTALSGAGCIDGIGLAMSDLMSLRFWLEVLNLSWGDFIVFDGHKTAMNKSQWAGDKWQDFVVRMLYRAPSMLFLFLTYALFGRGVYTANCGTQSWYYSAGMWMFLIMFCLSASDYKPFARFARFMCMSPFIRQVHQLLKFTFAGDHPPPMMYVTDGGVQDCTTVDLLMKRRVERILMISCGQDPLCKMGNFRDAMRKAERDGLGCFYVPSDPRKEVFVLLDEFQADHTTAHLHVGIRYPPHPQTKQASYGHLIIVKNKLPTDLEHQKVLPPITEEEVMTGRKTAPSAEFHEYWGALETDQLGPAGCCDCCHVNKMNCLQKWPQGFAGNYLWLSPMFCSSLMRLAHEVSGPAIKMISGQADLAAAWEHSVNVPRASTHSNMAGFHVPSSQAMFDPIARIERFGST